MSTIGVGLEFDERLLALLADAGTGNYYYLPHAEALAPVVATELETARETLASALRVRIVPGPGVQVEDAAGYPLEAEGATVSFRPGALFAGQERRIWVTFQVDEDGRHEHELGRIQLDYTRRGEAQTLALAGVPRVGWVGTRAAFAAASPPEDYQRSVTVDAYNAVRARVAGAVAAGDQAAAKRALRSFRDDLGLLGEVAGEAATVEPQRELEALEARVEEAFLGGQREQQAKQNALGKREGNAARDARRPGAKRAPTPDAGAVRN